MNTKNVFSWGFSSRSVLMFSSMALSSVALGFTLYKTGPMAKIFAATPTDKCIVTISGVQYDLTTLGTMHSGPQGTTLTGPAGFFQCGTDMTAVYQGQHGTNMSRLAPYIYIAPVTVTPTPTPVIIGTSSPTPTPIISPTLGATPTASPSPIIIGRSDDDEEELSDHDEDDSMEQVDHENHERKDEDHSNSHKSKKKDSKKTNESHNDSEHSTRGEERHDES